MLTDLHIHGLAIIDKLAIRFGTGFNVITGETGAGKSILIRALTLLLGGKASADAVREGHSQALVSGHFLLAMDHPARSFLDELGVGCDSDGAHLSLLVRRTVTLKGRSSAWINDVPITMASLRGLARTLVDVFAQHDNQSLLDETHHLAHLDAFLPRDNHAAEVAKLYRAAGEELKGLTSLIATYQEQQKTQDYLQFRFTELSAFAPSTSDYERVAGVCAASQASQKKRELLTGIQQRIDQGADGEPLAQPLWTSLRALDKGGWEDDTQMAALAQETRELATRLDELSYQVERNLGAIDLNDEELDEAQERLARYQSLFRRFAVDDAEALAQETERMQRELAFLAQAMGSAAQCLVRLLGLSRKLMSAAKLLHGEREQAVGTLAARVKKEFKDLGMPKGQLGVQFEKHSQSLTHIGLNALGEDFALAHAPLWDEIAAGLGSMREQGGERVRLLLTTNPGEPLRPLAKVASGGEISRLMLALKKALAAEAQTAILVFDEIDTGISGRVADMVGRKIKELAATMQVICISHLPQVAAYADHHLQVTKTGSRTRTGVQIHHLDEEASVHELARLLSGESVTDDSLANARSLRQKRHGIDAR